MEIYLVGGAVRDELLGIIPKERDWVVVGAHPQELLAQGYRQVGKDFPVFLHPETQDEYALARTERKTGKGYAGFSVYAAPDVTLEDDLRRRDLTINAIAKAQDGSIIDPFGGKKDLDKRIFRHVSPAFVEDPLRILRVARFMARFADRGFTIATETVKLMQDIVKNGEIEALVAERVWQEMQRAMMEPTPSRFITTLRECGALAILFPEIDQLYGVPNPPKWHPEIDTGIHNELVVDQAAKLSNDPHVVFAALLHDLGKALTPKEKLPSHPGHEAAGVPLVKALCQRFKVPKSYRDLASLVCRYHLRVHQAEEIRPVTLLKTLESLDVFRRPQRFEQFLLACEADARGCQGFADRDYPQADIFRRAYQAAQQIPTKPLVEQGLSGDEIAKALHRQRLAAIKHMLAS